MRPRSNTCTGAEISRPASPPPPGEVPHSASASGKLVTQKSVCEDDDTAGLSPKNVPLVAQHTHVDEDEPLHVTVISTDKDSATASPTNSNSTASTSSAPDSRFYLPTSDSTDSAGGGLSSGGNNSPAHRASSQVGTSSQDVVVGIEDEGQVYMPDQDAYTKL